MPRAHAVLNRAVAVHYALSTFPISTIPRYIHYGESLLFYLELIHSIEFRKAFVITGSSKSNRIYVKGVVKPDGARAIVTMTGNLVTVFARLNRIVVPYQYLGLPADVFGPRHYDIIKFGKRKLIYGPFVRIPIKQLDLIRIDFDYVVIDVDSTGVHLHCPDYVWMKNEAYRNHVAKIMNYLKKKQNIEKIRKLAKEIRKQFAAVVNSSLDL